VDAKIDWIKADMAGAASTMAVLRGAAEFSLDVNIDAEGRLITADASAASLGGAMWPGHILTVIHREP
jgi:leucyl aminopeptidase